MFVLYDFVIAYWSGVHNPADGPSCWPDYEQGWEEVDCLLILQWKFCNLSVEALYLPEAQQWVMLNMYKPCLACVSVLQYLQLEEEGKTEAKVEKWPTSSESSQIDAIGMQRKKCRFMNSSLRMQEELKEGLLKILKSHEDLQRSVLKVSRDDLKDFRSDSEPSEDLLKSFEDALEGEIESRAPSGDFNEDQLEIEWAQLRPEGAQQRLFWHIIHNYA